jgi:hypothetical protein
MSTNHKTLEEFLRSLPEGDRQHYDGSALHGYYDKEKYRRTAAADLKHTSQQEGQYPPQR